MSDVVSTPSPTAVGGTARVARGVFTATLWLLAAAVVVQVYLAGLGFLADASYFVWHTMFARVIEASTVVLVVAGLLGRVGVWPLAWVFALLLLTGTQYMFINSDSGLMRAMHVGNAFSFFTIALLLALGQRQRARRPA